MKSFEHDYYLERIRYVRSEKDATRNGNKSRRELLLVSVFSKLISLMDFCGEK
jgi:hypothetical protein